MGQSALLKQRLDAHYPTVTSGSGVFLFDSNGRAYLDGSSGAMTANIGHGVAEIADALRQQASLVAFSYRTQFTNEPAERLARRLADRAPGDLNWVSFVNSGSEASELAIRTAVNHWSELGRPSKVKVLGRQLSYHGMTMGALSMSGHALRRKDYGSLLHVFPVAPPAYAYRYARAGESDSEYAARAAAEFEEALLREDPDTVAAIIVEPIVGAAGGALVPPVGYLALLREMCDRLDVLMVVDEVITGIGRTGHWFASEAEDIVPDIIVTGKGLSAGYTPVAAILLRANLVETMKAGSGGAPFGHTFSGNPLGAAACLAVLDYIERHEVLENVRARGVQLEAGLRRLAARYPIVADIRGRGLLWGFEFVADPVDKRPPRAESNASTQFVNECFARGLVIYPAGIAPLNNAVLITPPLVISALEVELLLSHLDEALRRTMERTFSW